MVDGQRARRQDLAHPVVLTATLLAVVAVLDPIGNVNSLIKPDQRLLFPAVLLLLLLAALPWRRATTGRSVAVVAVVLADAGSAAPSREQAHHATSSIACSADLLEVPDELASRYRTIAAGETSVILERLPSS